MKPVAHDAPEPAHHAGLTALLAFVIGMLLSCPAHAGAGVWTSGGPSVRIDAVAIAPGAPATLYAGGHGVGVFKSTDAGGSWSSASAGLSNLRVYALAVNPMNPDTLYAGTYAVPDPAGIFKSTDAGGTWTRSDAGLAVRYVESLAIDPLTPEKLYAGTDGTYGFGGIYRSTDAGASWAMARPVPGAVVTALAVDPTSPTTLYAGVAGFGYYPPPGSYYGWVYKSTDSGGTWADTGLSAAVGALAIDPANPSRLYAGTSDRGLFASTDAGGTWAAASAGLASRKVNALAVDPTKPGTLYAGTNGGVFKSSDAGGTWGPANTGLGSLGVACLALEPTAPTTLYAGLDLGGVWQSTPPPRAFLKGDLDSNGVSDLVFRSNVDTTRNKVWFMDGVRRAGEAPITPDAPSADWWIRGVDDFDGDGQNDLAFWNRNTGQVEFWLMNGTVRAGEPVPLAGPPALAPNWELAATRDFNHDDRPDIVWRDSSSQKIVVWTMNGTSKLGELVPTPDQAANANWAVVAALDYNDDGNTDFLWYNSTSGKIVTWYMDFGVARTSGQFTSPSTAGNNNWKVLASSDYSRDYVPGTPPLGSPDVVWRNETSGSQVVWHLDFASTRVHGEFTAPPANRPALDWTVVGPR